MIAIIDLPLRGTNKLDGHDVMVIGFFVEGTRVGEVVHGGPPRVLYIDQDGDLMEANLSEININWRFDDKIRRFVDVDTGEELGGTDDDGV